MKIFKRIAKIIGVILLLLALTAGLIYTFVLQYPTLKAEPKLGKWYKMTSPEMKDSTGGAFRTFIKKGSENKVMIYFAGGGASFNEETAKDPENFYFHGAVPTDYLANLTMNMGGLATDSEESPFKDWTIVLVPYATADFHSGTGEFHYTNDKGEDKILYHNGYTNYTETMKQVVEVAGIDNPDTVLVTGYSAGGFGAAILADDIFTNYYPNAKSKNLLVDSSLLIYQDWQSTAENVWQTPNYISSKMVSDNLTLDMLNDLNTKYGEGINLMFDSSTRDGDLAKYQNYIETGSFDVNEKEADKYQARLKELVPEFQKANVQLFFWDGLQYYDDTLNMTMHTIIAAPYVWQEFEEQGQSIAAWLQENMAGQDTSYGLDLLDKVYE
ncbi:pectin acetylesterase-family hydrolase [Streptococcus henryi]|uniref:pectin acetylesterase-family hydrolase n=1 Tax=Streptococcus henryi TaxID=439219 RepID=UPI00037E6D9D|nr:pectin acetylesterase-family hydrolase [Streptococcus henryi]